MSDTTAITVGEAKSLSLDLAKASLLPDALRRKPEDILAIILTGAELGLPPMTAIRGIQIIQGKPTLSADTMGALVRRRKDVCEYLRVVETTPAKCTVETKRAGDPSPQTITWTLEQARRAGLGGQNWTKYPDAMLRARAMSAICRMVYPDICLGLYDFDELSPQQPQRQQEEQARPRQVDVIKEKIEEAKFVTVEPTDEEPPPPEAPIDSQDEQGAAPEPEQQSVEAESDFVWPYKTHRSFGEKIDKVPVGLLRWASNHAAIPGVKELCVAELQRRGER